MTTLFVGADEHEAVITCDSSVWPPSAPGSTAPDINPRQKVHPLTSDLLFVSSGRMTTDHDLYEHLLSRRVRTVEKAAEVAMAFLEPRCGNARLHCYFLGRGSEGSGVVFAMIQGRPSASDAALRAAGRDPYHSDEDDIGGTGLPYEGAMYTPDADFIALKPGLDEVHDLVERALKHEARSARQAAVLAVIETAARMPRSNAIVDDLWALPLSGGPAVRVGHEEIRQIERELRSAP